MFVTAHEKSIGDPVKQATEVGICWEKTAFLLRTAVGLSRDDKHRGIADCAELLHLPQR